MLNKTQLEVIAQRRKLTLAIGIIVLMLMSSLFSLIQTVATTESATQETTLVQGGQLGYSLAQTPGQSGQGGWTGSQDVATGNLHEALSNIMWSDPGVSAGIIVDLSVLASVIPSYSILLEENAVGDHDNDGINDLNDLDDDNDGIYDLLERFDGCYGTDPYDHDNDGILDIDDWDDDNDGILEGPIDYDALEALGLFPRNVSTDRYLDSSIVHPWTGQAVGPNYLADQNPFDHDNDGVTDEDSDGSGAGRYDEDDDNDGRIDQFTWPCDMDWDGIPDYFDDDDDNDGTPDVDDEHPYDNSIDTTMASTGNYDAAAQWDFSDYRAFSGGVDYVEWEKNRVNAVGASASGFQALGAQGTPSFTVIWDGDLDGDGSPNFLDPDNDNDGTPDSADTDDDNDGILDMSDPDDDNDGIPDTCIEIDTNNDDRSDYTGAENGVVTGLSAGTLAGGQGYSTQNNVPATGDGVELTVDIVATGGVITSVSVNHGGRGFSAGDTITISGGNSNGTIQVASVSTMLFEIPGADGNGDGTIDCELDYDGDLDDDRTRPFDQNYNGKPDWLDTDMGGTESPDNLGNFAVGGVDIEYDLDNDQIENENDSFPLDAAADVATWNCPTIANPNPVNPDPRCQTRRASFSQFNDWDGDGISNWDDVDDDNDGIIDMLDIDWDCDLDNDNDLHTINGALYRDDGPNNVDSDIDGDGLENSIDWDDDNDGISDLYDPDDGNCGLLDFDSTDSFSTPYYPIGDGGALDGSLDGQVYSDNVSDHWNMVFHYNPFEEVVLNYNGYDGTTNPVTPGVVPEFYWFMFARWSPYNGGNEWDIDADGDSLINGLDIDQDADGMPDWWDQDEGNDGIMDVDDIKMGGTFNLSSCGWTAGSIAQGFVCGYNYAIAYKMPLNGVNAQFGSPYSTRPDAALDQGPTAGGPSGNWSCTPGAQGGCWHYDFGADGNIDSGISFTQIENNRDAFVTWMGLATGLWQWNSDNGPEADFPDELGADLLKNEEDGDIEGDFTNNTIDIDDDYDAIFDWYDVDDDNDGVWDYFEIDTNDDLDDDANQENGNFFNGLNCVDNDDDGNDADADGDGFYQAVWDRGIMSQGLRSPSLYDVDNDNDAIPDGEDPDDDNNGILDVDQELIPGCFWGEEQSTFDHDDDGIVDWMDDDWDGDGRTNTAELLVSITAPFDHDNDGTRDDLDEDDDQDGMHDEDEVLLWPTRFNRNSTNPWDHDDFGDGEGMANPNDSGTGPDVLDQDDDNDTFDDVDYDYLEEGTTAAPPCPASVTLTSDWDHDNDCIPDEDDKAPTFITLNLPDTLWLDARSPAIFSGHVDWVNPVTGSVEPAPQLPVQVHIEWTGNNTTAVESVDVLTTAGGNFSVGQFLYPEMLNVGDNTTYRVYAEVTEMFTFNGNQSQSYYIGAEANLTVDYSAWTYFRSDEQPFWLDFKSHYTADWDRGFFDNRIRHAPITFSIFGGLFGNLTSPTNFTGLGNNGYRTDASGWASLTFVQDAGVAGTWKQVQWNSTADNGDGQVPGGYEQIVWNDLSKQHDVVLNATGQPLRYDYTNTSLPPGDIEVIARVSPELANEAPFPYLHGDESEPFSIRVMHRMNIEGTMIVDGLSPVYYYDSTVNNGDGTFGDWATLFHQPALDAAGVDYNVVSAYKPYPKSWDGTANGLTGQAAALRPFLSANGTHWFISLVNGGDSNLPPCGPVDRTDPDSLVRCEIVPEMNTQESLQVIGKVTNRTNEPWDADPIALQVDVDKNGQFLGAGETAYTQRPVMKNGDAAFDYNWSWFSQYGAGTYGMRVDFTNSAYYFTGNTSSLATTGAYINVTVVGTTDFLTTSVPRLYRNTNTTIQAKLVDNSLQPVRNAPVNYTWSFDGRTGVNYTDSNGFFEIPFNVSATDDLGNFTLQFEYAGTSLLKGNTASQSVWVVSRTYMKVVSADPNVRRSGDRWDFTAQVLDDNKTSVRDGGGTALSGSTSPNGGLVDVIFEGSDFEGTLHRQVVATIAPSAGVISLPEIEPDGSHLCFYDGNGDGVPDRDIDGDGLEESETIGCMKANISPLNPQLLRDDPESFLPDGFGPVNVILRFQETLPNEGCKPIEVSYLGIQGAWDPCVTIPGNDHFRLTMTYNANGFALIGRTVMTVDDQIVYTSQVNPQTGEVEPKPMVVTGQLRDELGINLTSRSIRVNYEMVNGQTGPIACPTGVTDEGGYFSVECPLTNVMAGKAKVTVMYSSYDNNDAYRYENKTVQTEFDVFSNSTLLITEVGPFKSSVDQYVAPNGSRYPVLYLKESFHIDAFLAQTNGQFVGGKCLNIYLDPLKNVRPLATIRTSDIDGTISWFSGDPVQNPTLRGVETTGGTTEGFRTLRVAFEPDRNVPGGCDKDNSNALNGSAMDLLVLVRSRVDLQVKQTWSHAGENGVPEGYKVRGEIALLRDRLDLAVENEEVIFSYQYFDISTGEWVTSDLNNKTRTNEQGIASFEWIFNGRTCDGEPCIGEWRITAFYPGSTLFAASQDNITHEIHYKKADVADAAGGLFSPENMVGISIILMALLIAGAMYWQRVQERRQVQALRGILTDAMMQLEASNEYIAAIFDCYKSLVKHFKKYGFMKKVYETAREFEAAVRAAFSMVPADQMNDFLSIFEEARYSEHTIDASHRDRAIQTLNSITNSLSMSLGEESIVKRIDLAGLYETQTKAGQFVAADGSVRQAGLVEGEGSDFKI